MNIKLNKLRIENFKGIKLLEVKLDGDNGVITAENGVGKTTVYDAFLWLFFGKDSDGKKDFSVRPLDKNNEPKKGVVVAVEAELDCDGVATILRKESHEIIVKKQLRGYEAKCKIDEVPKKIGEFNTYIAENLVDEYRFKVLTDLTHFNDTLHWSKRRDILLEITGDIEKPEGFEDLLTLAANRSVAEYKSVLLERKSKVVKERDQINTRIDEVQHGLDEYAGSENGSADAETQRSTIQAGIDGLEKERQGLLDEGKERQKNIDHLNELTEKRTKRMAELAGDTTGVKSLLDEKVEIEQGVSNKQSAVNAAQNDCDKIKMEMSKVNLELTASLDNRNKLAEMKKALLEPITDATCPTCKQAVPTDQIKILEDKREEELALVNTKGKAAKAELLQNRGKLDKLQESLKEAVKEFEKLSNESSEATISKATRFAEIDKQIEEYKAGLTPANDVVCKQLYNEQIEAQKKISEPVSEQLEKIEADLKSQGEALAKVNLTLAQADTMKKNAKRIKELQNNETELAQKIADIEKELETISNYETAESTLIENQVNCMFKHVTFKLFKQNLNGSIEPTCQAILYGVPYPDMSAGQKIFVGIDIINVLSANADVSVPIFIDHAESLTLPVETSMQTIKLFAKVGVKELVVEVA